MTVYILNDARTTGWLLGWRWMLDLKPHIINKNKFQMKFSKTMSLEKAQYFPPEKQAPWTLFSGKGVKRDPHCYKF